MFRKTMKDGNDDNNNNKKKGQRECVGIPANMRGGQVVVVAGAHVHIRWIITIGSRICSRLYQGV